MRLIDLDQIEFLKVDGNKEFNHGVDCCINKLLRAKPIEAVSLDKVKQAREEIENLRLHKAKYITSDNKVCIDSEAVLEILDKMMEGGE